MECTCYYKLHILSPPCSHLSKCHPKGEKSHQEAVALAYHVNQLETQVGLCYYGNLAPTFIGCVVLP